MHVSCGVIGDDLSPSEMPFELFSSTAEFFTRPAAAEAAATGIMLAAGYKFAGLDKPGPTTFGSASIGPIDLCGIYLIATSFDLHAVHGAGHPLASIAHL